MGNIKKIFAVLFGTIAVMLMSITAFAYTGSGTEDDPYIMTDYKEFADLARDNIASAYNTTPREKWYKLGSDISTTANSIDDHAIFIGSERGYESIMHLDLAGHTSRCYNISR